MGHVRRAFFYPEDLADDNSGDLEDLGDSLGPAGCVTNTLRGGLD